MRILAICQTENAEVAAQISAQTVLPDHTVLLIDNKPAKSINDRRRRIVDNHQELMHIVEDYEPDLVWQVEGDCILPNDALSRLLSHYKKLKGDKFGYISGVQVGRHGIYSLGAWHFNKHRSEFWSQDYKAKGLQRVDATGFYCLLAERETWLNGTCEWSDERWGPDVNFGLSLRELGYNIYVDMGLGVGHKTPNRGVINTQHVSICNVRFWQDDGKWRYRTS